MKKALMIAFVVMLTITAQLVSNAHEVIRNAADTEHFLQDLVENQTAQEFDYDKAVDTLIEKMKESGIIAPPKKTFGERFTEWASELNVLKALCWIFALILLGMIAAAKLSKITEIGQTIKHVKSQNDEMSHQIETLAEMYDKLKADTESVLSRIEQIQSENKYTNISKEFEETMPEEEINEDTTGIFLKNGVI